MFLHAFIVFIFGTIIGSFLNVVILRYNSGKSFLNGRSRCFSCKKNLKWCELVPVFSFLIQCGKCRGCGSKISWQYPAVELITGILYVLIYLKFANYLLLVVSYWLLVSLLIVIAMYDFRHFIIPNKTVWLFNFFALILLLVTSYLLLVTNFVNYFLSGLAFFAFFALLWLVSRGRWMGFGDAKLALGLGWLLGPNQAFSAFLLSFWLGAIIGIFLIILNKGKYSVKSQIPFGPFLALGAIVSLLLDLNLLNLFILK